MRKVILAVDAYYSADWARIGGVIFEDWPDRDPRETYISTLEGVAAYEAGLFFKRELPCILKLIEEHRLKPEIVVIDGLVYLDGHSKPGLGKYLYDALGGGVKVIGVAKKPFKDLGTDYEIYRGGSRRPLFVTAVGLPLDQARACVRAMHGSNRLPTLLKQVDRLCRGTHNDKE